MTPVQLRMARAAVGWGVRDVAAHAGLTANTVTRIENGADAKQSTLNAIQRALEAVGVIFLDDGELTSGGVGVRLTKVRKFKEIRGYGDASKRMIYVVNTDLMPPPEDGFEWREDLSFDEAREVADNPKLAAVLLMARQGGILLV